MCKSNQNSSHWRLLSNTIEQKHPYFNDSAANISTSSARKKNKFHNRQRSHRWSSLKCSVNIAHKRYIITALKLESRRVSALCVWEKEWRRNKKHFLWLFYLLRNCVSTNICCCRSVRNKFPSRLLFNFGGCKLI